MTTFAPVICARVREPNLKSEQSEIVLARETQVLIDVAPRIYDDGKPFSTTRDVTDRVLCGLVSYAVPSAASPNAGSKRLLTNGS